MILEYILLYLDNLGQLLKGGTTMSIYDIKLRTIDFEEITMDVFKGKVLLIVNTASNWGFTPQYEELEALYQKLGNEHFEILGFPCNQFGNQEPGDTAQIKSFCSFNFGVTFPMFDKVDVKGLNAHPLFVHLTNAKKGLVGKDIKWNFTKFIVDSKGNVVDRIASATSPLKLEEKIKQLIDEAS